MQPLGPSINPDGHMLHFFPPIPGLQMHWPVICSQSSLTDPNKEQAQAGIGNIFFNEYSSIECSCQRLKSTYVDSLCFRIEFGEVPSSQVRNDRIWSPQLLVCIGTG